MVDKKAENSSRRLHFPEKPNLSDLTPRAVENALKLLSDKLDVLFDENNKIVAWRKKSILDIVSHYNCLADPKNNLSINKLIDDNSAEVNEVDSNPHKLPASRLFFNDVYEEFNRVIAAKASQNQ